VGPAPPSVFAFQCVLVPYTPLVAEPAEPVLRTIAVREDQTLEQLHEAIRIAFGLADPHMYAFWMSGKWWIGTARATRRRSSWIRTTGKTVAYLFDYGDEWRLLLKMSIAGRRATRATRC
jgi:Plasmid pRiA4b ORF-3-like protein